MVFLNHPLAAAFFVDDEPRGGSRAVADTEVRHAIPSRQKSWLT